MQDFQEWTVVKSKMGAQSVILTMVIFAIVFALMISPINVLGYPFVLQQPFVTPFLGALLGAGIAAVVFGLWDNVKLRIRDGKVFVKHRFFFMWLPWEVRLGSPKSVDVFDEKTLRLNYSKDSTLGLKVLLRFKTVEDGSRFRQLMGFSS